MAHSNRMNDWILVPSTSNEIEAVRKKCRHMVMRRAAISAGVAAVPIPGLDVATDIGMLANLIDDINIEFGLTPAQIDRMQPQLRVLAYKMLVGMGSVLVGKVVTRELVLHLLSQVGIKTMIKYSAKIVPLAGQVVSAAVGFTAFRMIGFQHIDACADAAAEMIVLRSNSGL